MSIAKKKRNSIPTLNTEQMIEVDRLMIEKYQINLLQMMENAGRCLALVAMERFLNKRRKKKSVIVMAGTGGNGGGALVCARRLYNWGSNVVVYLSANANKMTPVPAHQLSIIKAIGIPVYNGTQITQLESAELIIDGLIGYSLSGNPSGLTAEMIEWANAQKAHVLALDTPSGLDLTTGTIHEPAIKANATLTLALPKQGLYSKNVKEIRGELYLGDISVPPVLYAEKSLNIKVPPSLFASSDIVRIVKTKTNVSQK